MTTFADVVHQLRIYEIFDHNKQAFHDRFRDHAMRIMKKYDFNIVAMWEAKNGARTEFVYLLEWPDEPTMQDRWAKFMADPEWSAIKKETARSTARSSARFRIGPCNSPLTRRASRASSSAGARAESSSSARCRWVRRGRRSACPPAESE